MTRPPHNILRDICRNLVEDYDENPGNLEKFVFSGKESLFAFIEVAQTVGSIKLYSDFLIVTLDNETCFSIKLSTSFTYFLYILGRYVRSLSVFELCPVKHCFFQGLIDNEGLTEIKFNGFVEDLAWMAILKSVQKISAHWEFYKHLSTFGGDFSFKSLTVISTMKYGDFSEFLELEHFKTKELTIELHPVDYDDSLFRPIENWSSLSKITLTINSNVDKPVGLPELVNKLPVMFPNLDYCYLENITEDETLDGNLIKESIAEIQNQFSTYSGKTKVDIKWIIVNEIHLHWDENLLETFRKEIQDRFPNYRKNEDMGIHEWTEKKSLTSNLSFELVITVNETEYEEEEMNQILQDAGIYDDVDYDYYDQMDDVDVDEYDDYDYDGEF